MKSYVELHARSAFSFLRGGSQPVDLVGACAGRGLAAVALCDRGGVYGAVRLHGAAREAGLRALVGCELRMEDETVVPVLAATREGYRTLCSLLTTAHLGAPKGEGRVGWDQLASHNTGLIALTGDEEGPVRSAWRAHGAAAAEAAGARLRAAFGSDRLYVELQRHLAVGEERENAFLVDWAQAGRLPILATNGVLHAKPEDRRVLDVFTCLRHGRTLDSAGRLLSSNAERHVKDARAMNTLFADLPEAIENTTRLAERLEFTLEDLGYRFPDYAVPPDETQDGALRRIAYDGAARRYGSIPDDARRQLERELTLIAHLGFSGYFLIVWDLCEFARGKSILVQGRGSAANSIVCYALAITAVDPIKNRLLFERFLSEGRTDWPDIDLDFPSGDRRETVIQEVYRRYGRRGAAMTANVICFRGRNTLREVGKAFGLPDDVLSRFSSLFHSGDYPDTLVLGDQVRMAGIAADHPRLPALLDACARIRGLPRHLGQHSGGMVLSANPLDRFIPLENARMPGRSVLQWDKDDCEDMGIVKVDLLGLGMMSVLQDATEICAQRGEPVDLAQLPTDDPETFHMIREADTVGVFQIESRAQMATLPRMKPLNFYDLVIEVAIIRPGPIHGDAVNPYLERRAGRAPVTYPDERARPILERTLGIVLFQEQILSLAMVLGRFSPAEADELRRAIGFRRSDERLKRMEARLEAALRANGVKEESVHYLIRSLASFSLYGFPESHAISFALLVYASAWLKVHRPAAFHASLLNCQPMGFYSPASLVQDARRHGIATLPVCVQVSAEHCSVERDDAVRLGLSSVRGLRAEPIRGLLRERRARPFASTEDFLRRTHFNPPERRALAESGALNALAGHRRAALWHVECLHAGDDLFRASAPASSPPAPAPPWSPAADPPSGLPAEALPAESLAPEVLPSEATPLEAMTHLERIHADYLTLSLTTGAHPMKLLRPHLRGVTPAGELGRLPNGTRVRIGGAVITRQRPGTAKGFCFITLEDETGHANAIVRPALFEVRRLVINLESALIITGRLQNHDKVIHVMAEQIARLPSPGLPEEASHDFH